MQTDFITSRLTAKSQTVIPVAIRRRLRLKPGDVVRYLMRGDRVEIEKVDAVQPSLDPFAAFSEWASPEDDEAYSDL